MKEVDPCISVYFPYSYPFFKDGNALKKKALKKARNPLKKERIAPETALRDPKDG